MLGKLMKYEWKGYRFPLLIMLIVLAATTALTCGVILTINPKYDETITGYSIMALILSIFLYYFGIIGCTLGTLLIIAIRFYKTCYTDQGYLTHTLPVSPKQILNSKIIMSTIVYFLILLAIAVSIFFIIQVGLNHIISLSPYDYEEFKREFFTEMEFMAEEFKEEFGLSIGMCIAYFICYFIIACTANIIIVLGCVSLGQLYAKHRIVGAIAAYFVVQFIQQIFGYIFSIPMYSKMLRAEYNGNATVFGITSPTMNLTLLSVVVMAVAMYFINLHMMTKKLNLE